MTTLGELKVRCIKKTQMDDRNGFTAETIDTYKDNPEYKDYFNNVLDSINDGIQNLVANDRVPFKKTIISNASTTTTEIDISSLEISDLKSVVALYHESDGGTRERVNFISLVGIIELDDAYTGGQFILIYSPTIDLISEDTSDDTLMSSFGLEEIHCTYLVYYVRNELYGNVEEFTNERYIWKAAIEQYFEALKQEVYLPRQKRVKCVVKLD